MVGACQVKRFLTWTSVEVEIFLQCEKKNRPLQNRLTLHVFMVLWFRFFSTWCFYWNLEPFCISLHLVGLFWNRSLYFGEFSRALLVLSSLVNSPFAELSLQNLRNKWGGGYKGVQTSYLPYIAFPTERPPLFLLTSFPIFSPFAIAK